MKKYILLLAAALIINASWAQIWEKSFEAGYTDINGHYMGGSQIMHLKAYNGCLFASVGYWMDSRCPWFEGPDPNTGWGQVLRLDSADGDWEVDLEMGPQFLRPEILHPIIFTTDSNGTLLPEPVTFLMTCNYTPKNGHVEVHTFTRDDVTGDWIKTWVYSGNDMRADNYSIRDVQVYKDKVTGVDRVFMTIGTQGIFSGVYDPALAGKIRWGTQPEEGPLGSRPLGIVEANNSLFFSSGPYVYKRNDGISPSYTIVHDMVDLMGDSVSSAIGGIRGLTSIPNPNGTGESIIFMWTASTSDRGDIFRLDPDRNGGFVRNLEVTIGDLMSNYLNGNPCYFVLGAYNRFLPINLTGQTEYIIGFDSWIGGSTYPTHWGDERGGFYKGAVYALRNENGNSYRIEEVNGPIGKNDPPLVTTLSYEISPFPNEKAIYFGGLDPNYHEATNMAWIYKVYFGIRD